MEDDAERVPMSLRNLAHAVPHLDPIVAPCAAHRSTVDREHDSIAFRERDYGYTRLHSRTLFGQHELAAAEMLSKRSIRTGPVRTRWRVT